MHGKTYGYVACLFLFCSVTACAGTLAEPSAAQDPAAVTQAGNDSAAEVVSKNKRSAKIAPTEQEPAFEKTFRLEKGERSPPATLDDVNWLVGNWIGTAFGSEMEEVWNPPSAGSMVGLFKLFDDNGINFYEILALMETEGSLEMRVKHFGGDFVAWEDKEDFITFPLVAIEKDAIHFSGLSFYRLGDDRIDGYIRMRRKSGVSEEKLEYHRR